MVRPDFSKYVVHFASDRLPFCHLAETDANRKKATSELNAFEKLTSMLHGNESGLPKCLGSIGTRFVLPNAPGQVFSNTHLSTHRSESDFPKHFYLPVAADRAFI